jgi:hypothetical protein
MFLPVLFLPGRPIRIISSPAGQIARVQQVAKVAGSTRNSLPWVARRREIILHDFGGRTGARSGAREVRALCRLVRVSTLAVNLRSEHGRAEKAPEEGSRNRRIRLRGLVQPTQSCEMGRIVSLSGPGPGSFREFKGVRLECHEVKPQPPCRSIVYVGPSSASSSKDIASGGAS